MFVDIRGFTAAASTRTPQQLVDRLDTAFAVLVDIVDRNGGIVNKFLGDVTDEMEAIEIVKHAHVEWCRGGALFPVAAHVNVPSSPARLPWPIVI
jgi:adenylate cyclase